MQIILVEADLLNSSGKLVAKGLITYAIIDL